METPDTLRDAIIWLSDFEHCRQFMVSLRWPDGIVKCPQCGSDHITYLAKNRIWKCYAKHERPTFSLKTGTIFEDSPTTLEKWRPAAPLPVLRLRNGRSRRTATRPRRLDRCHVRTGRRCGHRRHTCCGRQKRLATTESETVFRIRLGHLDSSQGSQPIHCNRARPLT